jgi:hypothetical protein
VRAIQVRWCRRAHRGRPGHHTCLEHTMRMRIFTPLLVIGTLSLAGCGDDATSPRQDDHVGRAAFTYASPNSPVNGSFAAEGARPADVLTGTWAAASTDDADAYVVALRQTGEQWEQLIVYIPGASLGTSAIVPDCDNSCAFVALTVRKSMGGVSYQYLCEVMQGTVSVTSLTDSRIKGTFSGTGICESQDNPNQPSVTITGGTFDAPLLAG